MSHESNTSTPLIVDSHVHAFPSLLGSPPIREDLYEQLVHRGLLGGLRRQLKSWWSPIAGSMHYSQTLLRHLPEQLRRNIDELSALAPIVSILFESSIYDLIETLNKNSVSRALLIAHPPFVSNEFVLECCATYPQLAPVVNIPRSVRRASLQLKNYACHGAKALKIHPAVDGEGADFPRYKTLIKTAASLGLPVIIHTGSANSHLIYKAPHQSRAERFIPWFKTYKDTHFILAHMNFHEPQIAMDLAEEFSNVYLECSWQPSEIIGETVRRLGAEKLMFGSDWPFVGNNISVGLSRIQNSIQTGLVTEEQSRKILGENAQKIFSLKSELIQN